MKKKIEEYLDLIVFSVKMAILVFVFCLIASFACNVSTWEGILFFLYQIFFIFFPGFLVVLAFHPKLATNVEWFGMSYFCGYVFNIFLYFLVVPIHLGRITGILFQNILLIIIMIGAAVFLLKRRTDPVVCKRDRAGEIICIVLVLASLVLELFSYSGKNMIPNVLPETDFESDILYWIGNIIELSKEFPPLNFRNYPRPYNYHYLSSLQLALVTSVTNIRPMVLGIVFHYVQAVFIYVFGLYFLFTRFSKNRAIVALVMAVALFSTGLEEQTFILYNLKLHIVPIGFDYGFGCFIWVMYLVWRFSETGKPNFRLIVLLWVAILILTGVKGPFGIAAVLICGLLCLFKLFRKEAKAALFTGLPILAAFLIAFFFITNVTGYINKGLLEYFHGAGSGAENNQLQNSLYGIRYSALLTAEIPAVFKAAAIPVFTVVYIIAANPFIAALELSAIIRAILKKRIFEPFNLSLILSVLILNLVTLNFHILGSSEMFFSLASLPVGLILFMNNARESETQEAAYLGACVLIGLTCFFLNTAFNELSYSLKRGMAGILKHEITLNADAYTYRNHVTRKQKEGFEYLRNLPGELVLTNNNDLAMGCFTEKYSIQNEEWKELFSEADETKTVQKLEDMIEYGINYVVVDRIQLSDYELKDERAELIFENADIGIYALEGSG